MMRQLLVLALILLSGCAQSPKQQTNVELAQLPVIGGVIASDTTLDGDYLLTSDLQVPAGLTLRIQPGTRVFIEPSDSTKIDPEYLSREVELIVRGRLLALGSAEQPIRFLPQGENPEDILWAGIELVSSKGSRLQHLVIEQAEVGVLCLDSSPEISSVRILHSRYGIILQQRSAPKIVDSLLTDGEAGLFCWDQSAPQVENSRMVRLQEEGIYLGRECRASLFGNLIKQTDRALVMPAGLSIAAGNRLVDNRLDVVTYPQEAGR